MLLQCPTWRRRCQRAGIYRLPRIFCTGAAHRLFPVYLYIARGARGMARVSCGIVERGSSVCLAILSETSQPQSTNGSVGVANESLADAFVPKAQSCLHGSLQTVLSLLPTLHGNRREKAHNNAPPYHHRGAQRHPIYLITSLYPNCVK